ncbi:MAG TPA: energy-coupling factor transporter ATPase, partial [Clostridia bacterium]
AMKPECIVLDESTAMLDPKGRKEVLDVIHKLNKEDGITIILITHHMEEAKDADTVYVLDNGRLALSGSPKEVFSKVHEIYESGLEVPPVTDLIEKLKEKGIDLPSGISDINEAADAISRYIRNTSGGCHVDSN